MRSINDETRLTMNSRRNFVNYATMTLANGTVLNLTPSDFRLSGQSFTDDWVDGEEFQIGTAIGKTATLLLDNTDGRVETVGSSEVVYPHGKFSEYDFYMAYFSLYVCLPEAYHYGGELRDEIIPIGIFTVTTPTAHGSTIEITGVDNMYLFDKSFDQCDLDFSTNPTLLTIINKCCEDCNVAIGYSQTFTNYALTVSERPESTTYRQVVSWVAQIAGCNATITSTGALTLKSYDMSALIGLDGGSFLSDGEEFLYIRKITWDGAGGVYDGTGWNTYYPRVKRTGTYKVTRVVIENIEDPSMFEGRYEIRQYDSFNGTEGANLVRDNNHTVKQGTLVEGENIVDYDITIETLNNEPYWIGVINDLYVDPNASKFDATFYLEPISYADGDSADGGTFEPERMYGSQAWTLSSGFMDGDIRWQYRQYRCPQYITPAGKYTITRIYIDDVADPTHFNAIYQIQKSTDGGTTWTTEDSGALVEGDNTINFTMTLPNSNDTRYRCRVGQDVVADPDASSFYMRHYFKADDTLYLNGDSVDGGSFNAILGFHNLTSISGTSVCTDNVKFTGVEVNNDDTSIHYPSSTGWDNYCMVVEDNPFTKNHESVVAQSIYNAISGLNFRPFSTQSLQDPTIEAGDPCVVYDVKGGMYFSIVTNVKFKTGGMTEVSCNAEPPARQISQYTSSAAYARRKQIEYNAQVDHFNQIASAALGYYKTEEVDAQTGATITYLHNLANLADSDIVVKIASGIVAISDNYNTPQRSWNTGFDASTGTMLLNLIYVHGLTSDWIKTGYLTVGGVNNIDGVIHVVNEYNSNNATWNGSGHEGGGWWNSQAFGYTWVKPAGTYKITKVVIDNISSEPDFVDFKLQVGISTDHGSHYSLVKEQPLVKGDNILDFVMDITETDEKMYIIWIGKFHVVATDPTFSIHFYRTSVNTTIDKDGVQIRRGDVKLGTYNSTTQHYPFEATNDGNLYAIQGKIAGYDIAASGDREGFTYVTSEYFCQYSKYKIHIGGLWGTHDDGYWTFFGVANKGEFAHLDYGGSNSGGMWITKNGKNDMYNFDGSFNHIYADGFYIEHDIDGTNTNTFYTNFDRDEARVNLYAWVVARIMVYSTGTSMGYYYSYLGPSSVSDIRKKENIKEFTHEQLDKFYKVLTPSYFNFKDNPEKVTRYGVIAQNLEEALDEAELDRGVIIQEEDDGIKTVVYTELMGIALGGIKDLYKKIDEQQAEIDDLKQRLERLESIVNAKE